MRIWILLLSLLSAGIMQAQNSLVTILGRHTYDHYPARYIVSIYNSNWNAHKESAYRLDSTLQAMQMNYIIDSSFVRFDVNNAERYVQIITHSAEDVRQVSEISQYLGLTPSLHYEHVEVVGASQDSLCMLAYADARKRAEKMAKAIGKKVYRVRNVDDDIEKYLFYYERKLHTACQVKTANYVIDLLALLSDEPEYPLSNMVIQGQYALWVTFELK